MIFISCMIRDMFAAFADKEIEKSGIAKLDKGLFFEVHKRKGEKVKGDASVMLF